MARAPKTLDEWINKLQEAAGDSVDDDLLEELREVATPRGARAKIDALEKQLADAKPLIDLGLQTQRAPQIEKAFEGYEIKDVPPAVQKAMASFDGIDDANKVAEFAKDYGLKPKTADTGSATGSATGDVVGAAITTPPGTTPGQLGDANLLKQELAEADARGASRAEQAAIMTKHGLQVVDSAAQ